MCETNQILYYKIADHYLMISCEMEINEQQALPSFIPFKSEPPKENEPIILTVQLDTEKFKSDDLETKLLSNISLMWEERFRFQETATQYLTSILAHEEDEDDWIMASSKDFTYARIHPQQAELNTTQKLCWLIMVAYGQACLKHNTLMIHASVIQNGSEAFAFLGKSGTGKSTHSRLWIQHIPASELLNDDNPAIRIFNDGEVKIYGTPWSGKTVCFKQKSAKLAAIIRLEQYKENILIRKTGMEALVTLLPSGSAIRWNNELYSAMLNLLERIVSTTTVAHLQCLPNAQAAELCFKQLSKKENLKN